MAKKKKSASSKKKITKKTIAGNKKTSSPSKLPWMWIALIGTLIAYVMVFGNDFVNYDDDIYITENPLIQNLEIGNLFSKFYFSQYSPLAMSIMGIEFKIFGNNPAAIHAISLLFHLGNVALVFLIFKNLTKEIAIAGLVALFFGIHPVQVESVAWLSGSMKIGTYALFFFLSILFYLKYLEQDQKPKMMLAVFFMLLACLCKEQAVVLPVVLMAIDYFKDRKVFSSKVIAEKIPFFILALIFGVITLMATKSGQGENEFIPVSWSLGERLLFSFHASAMYIVKLIFPFDLSAYYTYPRQGEIPAYFYATPLLILGALAGAFIAIKKNLKWLAFGLLFFLINIGLSGLVSIMSVRDVIMADRYIYVAAIGVFFILIHFVYSFKNKISFPPYFLLFALAIGYSALTFSRVGKWKDSVSIFSDVISKESYKNGKVNPYLALPYNNRGVELKNKYKKLDEGMRDFESAIKANASYASGYLNRGNIFFNSNQDDKAIQDYNKVLELEPNNDKALSARGAIYGKRGQYDLALKDLSAAIEEDEYFLDAYSNRALVLMYKNSHGEAIKDLDAYLRLKPNTPSIHDLRGVCYATIGKYDAAIQDYNKAINLSPRQGAYYKNRSKAYRAKGQEAQANADAQKARELGAQ